MNANYHQRQTLRVVALTMLLVSLFTGDRSSMYWGLFFMLVAIGMDIWTKPAPLQLKTADKRR